MRAVPQKRFALRAWWKLDDFKAHVVLHERFDFRFIGALLILIWPPAKAWANIRRASAASECPPDLSGSLDQHACRSFHFRR